jgi:hypothetical protein
MSCCRICRNITDYQLLDRSPIFIIVERLYIFGICHECDYLFNRLFQLAIKDDKEQIKKELDSQLQPF